MRPYQGYTLFEMICTLLVVTTVLAAGAPAMQSLVRDARLTGLVSIYLNAYNSARYTAAATHRQVALCELDKRNACSGRWGDNLTMFYDDNRDGALNTPSDIIERIQLSSPAQIAVTLNAFGGTKHISLRSNGHFRRNGTLRFCPSGSRKGRAIVINVMGRARTEQIACPVR